MIGTLLVVLLVAVSTDAQANRLTGTIYKGSSTCSSGATTTITKDPYTSGSCTSTGFFDIAVTCSSGSAILTSYPSSFGGTCSGSPYSTTPFTLTTSITCGYFTVSGVTYSAQFSCSTSLSQPTTGAYWAGSYSVSGLCNKGRCCCPTGTQTITQSGSSLSLTGSRSTYTSMTCPSNPPPLLVQLPSAQSTSFQFVDPISQNSISVSKSGYYITSTNLDDSSCSEQLTCFSGTCLSDPTSVIVALLWWVYLIIGLGSFFCLCCIIIIVVVVCRRRRAPQTVTIQSMPTSPNNMFASTNSAYQPLRDENDSRLAGQGAYYPSQQTAYASAPAYGQAEYYPPPQPAYNGAQQPAYNGAQQSGKPSDLP